MTPRTPPTHHCAVCQTPLWADRWPYAACKDCGSKPCPHGNPPAACDRCDVESDRAYDERRGA